LDVRFGSLADIRQALGECLLIPYERTSSEPRIMSAKCQKRTCRMHDNLGCVGSLLSCGRSCSPLPAQIRRFGVGKKVAERNRLPFLSRALIASLYGLSHGIIDQAQYSGLVAAVIGSAVASLRGAPNAIVTG